MSLGVVTAHEGEQVTVEVRGAEWRAIPNNDLVPGADVVVSDVEGLRLAVERV